MILTARHLVAQPAQLVGVAADPGWVRTDGATLAELGWGEPPGGGSVQLDWLVPGFVDLHAHGGGGADMGAGPEEMAAAVAFHRGHGTTSTLVSLMSAPLDVLCRQLGQVADLAEQDPGVLGAHLEGPFLAAARSGAHDPSQLRAPDPHSIERLLVAARGRLRTLTLAPELPGSDAAIEQLVAARVVVAVGHTDADYDQASRAFERGATLATHLFNAMPPLHHRAPSPVGAALRSGARCEVISDGVHVHPALISLVAERPERLVLVTDAMAAAGAPDGEYELGGRPVRVAGGVARLSDTGALAGSTLTMDAAVRGAVSAGGLDPVAAIRAATSNPAAVLSGAGRFENPPAGLGEIAVGSRADLVGLDADLRVVLVIQGGRLLPGSNPPPPSRAG